MKDQFSQFNDAVNQMREFQLPFGFSLFDLVVVLVVFLIINKIMGGALIDAIKAKLGGKKPTDVPATASPATLAPEWKPGVENVNDVCVAAGINQAEVDAFIKTHWEEIRSPSAPPVPPQVARTAK